MDYYLKHKVNDLTEQEATITMTLSMVLNTHH